MLNNIYTLIQNSRFSNLSPHELKSIAKVLNFSLRSLRSLRTDMNLRQTEYISFY